MKKLALISLGIVFVAGGFIGCDSNPVDSENHTDHAESEAMLIISGTDTLLYQHEEEGILTENALRVTPGGESNIVKVKFQAHDGDLFQPEEDHFSLQTTVEDTTIAAVKKYGNRWEFTVAGKKAGSTILIVKLMHGDHPDFTGQGIPVTVSE